MGQGGCIFFVYQAVRFIYSLMVWQVEFAKRGKFWSTGFLEYRIFRVQRTEYRVQLPCGVFTFSTYYMYHEEYSVESVQSVDKIKSTDDRQQTTDYHPDGTVVRSPLTVVCCPFTSIRVDTRDTWRQNY